ncbi:hypothetical protein ACFVT2_34905 [Streptomyces sp. NPDC058000]|uniref:hypothetical protein n=1 Tax=Streptomyces sp. NPDC058000 TaxID=3346299 RepID=UPI0036F0C84E
MTTTSDPPYGVMAGTVGDDVITVHELIWADGTQRPKCGDGTPEDQVEEWIRRVNCPYCLNDEAAPAA